MRRQLEEQGLAARHEQARSLKLFADSMNQRMLEVRVMLETKIRICSRQRRAPGRDAQDGGRKLHATLESRLTASFQQVSERLERVHQGLGEMQQLALGVGDLKRVLTNVKTRGTWGEVQLEMLLEQVLTPDQYAKNVETIAGSGRAWSSRSSCRARATAARRCGCRSTPSSRKSSTNACWKRPTAPMPKAWRRPGASWNAPCARKPNHRREIRGAAAHHRLCHPVPAHRRLVCGSDAPSRPGR
jgi:hypothetical protein